MDEHLEPQPHQPPPVQWRPLLAIGITTSVISAFVVKGLTSVSLADLVKYGGGGLVVIFVCLSIVGALVNRRARRAEELEWRTNITGAVASLLHEVQRLKLADVIEHAEGEGWEVTVSENGGLLFTSPDQDQLEVIYAETEAHLVAQRLNELAPLHFGDDWRPNTDFYAMALHELDQRMDAVEDEAQKLSQQVHSSSVDDAVREAKADGWTVQWDNAGARVAFNRQVGSSSRGVSLPFDDLTGQKIRQALSSALQE